MTEAIKIHEPESEPDDGQPSYPPATTGEYQPLGWMPEGNFLALKNSIKSVGRVQVPIVRDEKGETLDGHHRELAVEQLRAEGAKVPHPTIETVVGLSEEEKRHHALRINLVRRQISRKKRRAIIAAELKRSPQLADAWLAEICGTTARTVRSVREELEARSEIKTVTEFQRRDGKKCPRHILSSNKREQKDVAEALEKLGDQLPAGELTPKRLKKAAKRMEAKENRPPVPLPTLDADIRLYHTPFQGMESMAHIQSGSAKLVLTDIPYDKNWLDAGNLSALAELAERILAPGGLFVTYVGSLYLDRILDQVRAAGLVYAWEATTCWSESGNPNYPRQVISKSKPILIFFKGEWKERAFWVDTFINTPKEKSHHPWQQSLEEAESLVAYFSQPGDLVVDPCGGSFTNAVACKRMGRRFIGCDQEAPCVATGLQRIAEEGDLKAVMTPPNLAEVTLPRKSIRLAVIRHEALDRWCEKDRNGEFFWEFKQSLEDSLHPIGILAIKASHDDLSRVFDEFYGWQHCGTISLASNRDWNPVVLFAKTIIEIDAALKTSLGNVEDEMWLLARLTEEGDSVLNIGSDTLAAACRYMDRHCVGWALDSEIEERHLAEAEVEENWIAPYIFSNPCVESGSPYRASHARNRNGRCVNPINVLAD